MNFLLMLNKVVNFNALYEMNTIDFFTVVLTCEFIGSFGKKKTNNKYKKLERKSDIHNNIYLKN
jgi:hypothetical protein